MRRTVELALIDLGHNDSFAAAGILDFLVVEQGYPIRRVAKLVHRKFRIPLATILSTLYILEAGTLHHC